MNPAGTDIADIPVCAAMSVSVGNSSVGQRPVFNSSLVGGTTCAVGKQIASNPFLAHHVHDEQLELVSRATYLFLEVFWIVARICGATRNILKQVKHGVVPLRLDDLVKRAEAELRTRREERVHVVS